MMLPISIPIVYLTLHQIEVVLDASQAPAPPPVKGLGERIA